MSDDETESKCVDSPSCCQGTLLLLLQNPLAFSRHLLSLWRWDQLVTTLKNRWFVVTLH